MTKALYIGQYIYSALVNNGITAKIYRIIADSNAKYPFIIYRRSGLVTTTTKDGICYQDVDVEIVVESDKYAVGLELADQVCSILTREDVEFEGIYIEDAKIMSASEDFIDNEGFIQRFTITFRILNN